MLFRSQLVLLWNMRRGITVIPASTNTDRLRENFLTFEFFSRPEILTIEERDIITSQNGPDGFTIIQTSSQAKENDR